MLVARLADSEAALARCDAQNRELLVLCNWQAARIADLNEEITTLNAVTKVETRS